MNTYKILSAIALVFLSGSLAAADTKAAKTENTLTIKVTNIRKTGGRLMLALYDSERAFNYAEERKAYVSLNLKLTSDIAQISLKNLPEGRYAAMLFHDENSNGAFDIKGEEPVEGYGTSGAIHALDEPSFKKASVKMADGNQSLTVKMHYFK